MRALVIGDIALDVRTSGSVEKISREAPVPVVNTTDVTESLGWAGGVAANIRALGHECLLMGVIGEDVPGNTIATLCSSLGIPSCLIKNGSTVVKHRIASNGQIIARFDSLKQPVDTTAALLVGLNGLGALADEIKVIVISDNGNATVTEALVTELRRFATNLGIPIFVDCRADSIHKYRGVSLLKPNMPDALAMLADDPHPALSAHWDPVEQLSAAVQQLHRRLSIPTVLVTHGRHGCAYTDNARSDGVQPHVAYLDAVGASAVDTVKDICGAGDTTMAALAVAYMEGKDIAASANFAMHAAGYVVQFYGVHPAYRNDVDEFIYQHGGWSAKIMNDKELVDFVNRKKVMDPYCRIGLANGCFDGFHAGHLETIRFAKSKSDVLIVAYNDDTSLRLLKGNTRPQVPDSYRASHLALQIPVDAVVRFNGDVEALVRMIKPTVLVKGADSRAQYGVLPGADYVASHGGTVEFCPTDNFYINLARPVDSN